MAKEMLVPKMAHGAWVRVSRTVMRCTGSGVRSLCRRCRKWRCDGSPGVGHDLGDGDALDRVGGEEPLQEMFAGVAGPPRRLVLPRHDAGEELLQALQVVAAVIAPLCKGQHSCAGKGNVQNLNV